VDEDQSRRKRRPLTPTESQILLQVARGHGFKTIAMSLSIAPTTVAYHVTRMRLLLGAPNIAALVTIAFLTGLISNDLSAFDGLID
jgi:DNA-binding CsgD family transcriptional regulator